MIDLIPSSEQGAIAEGVADFLREHFPIDRLRHSRGTVDDNWVDLAQLGAFGVSVPEESGGIGLGVVEDVLVFREFGRHLVSPAAIGTRVAAIAAAANGQEALCRDLLKGRRRAGLATPAGSGVQLLEVGTGDLCVAISGEILQVFDTDQLADREELFALDETLTLARGRLGKAPLITVTDRSLVLSVRLLAAAMLCGVLDVTRDMAVDYARTRQQFGVPIGVFQGIKHPCADIALAAEEAWSQVAYASLMLEAELPSAAFDVTAAKFVAGDNALVSARANIQIHGGMGFTDEVDAQLLLKRVHVLHQLFDDPRLVRQSLLELPLEI